MNPLLITLFACVGLGMLSSRWRIRLFPVVLVIGGLLTAVYLFLPRYM
jgi:hypothetical protein